MTTGEWSYALDNTRAATQALTGGQTVTDSLTVTSADGSASQAITVTVTGANDAASISGSASGSVTEDSDQPASGDLDIADVDAGEAAFRTPASFDGTYGTFTFNATTGAWSYVLDNTRAATQALRAVESVDEILTVVSADGSDSHMITVAVAGANDTATISGSATGSVTEDGTPTTSGTLDISDSDRDESAFQVPASLVGAYGTFTFNETTGAWSFTLDNGNAAVQALGTGATLTDTLTVSSLDSTASRDITVTINGATDSLVIDVATLTPAQGFIIQGDATYDWSGSSVSSAGDVNGDGFADMIVGARHGADGGSNAGEAYVVFGAPSGFGAADGAGRQVIDLTTFTAAQGFIIQGDAPGDWAGTSVSMAGDVNGDGFGDLIIGALFGDDGGDAAGEAYVVFGGAGGFGVADGAGRRVIDLTTLSAAQGFIIQGDAADESLGYSVSFAGDVNGDGFADLIVGAQRGDDGGEAAGEAYVVLGGADGFGAADGSGRQVIDLTTLSAAQGFIIQGDAAGDWVGFAVSTAGDLNGDGFADLIVGAPRGRDGGSSAGEAYVVFGGTGGFGVADAAGRQVIDLTTLSAAQGFIIQGDAAGDELGRSVSSAGDVNGDGFDDLIVGGLYGDDGGTNAGEAYLVFGGAGGFGVVDGAGRRVIDLTTLSAAQGFIIQGDAVQDRAGRSVSSAGDVNGDGFDDLIVGSPFSDDGGLDAGAAHVVFGGAGGFGVADGAGRRVIDLTSLSTAQGFIVQGHTLLGYVGWSVSAAGDVNGDGFDDLVVSAPLGDDGGPNAGESYVVFGGAFGGGSAPVTTTGTAAAEMLIGGRGDDSLSGGGGLDVLRGGAGDDRLGMADAGFRSVDGGNGTDTLAITGSGITLDLTVNPMPRMESVERIDLTGSGANTLVIDRLAVLGLTEQRSAGVTILTVDGNAGDTLRFTETSWSEAGTLVDGGVTYRRVVSADGSAEVRLAQAVTLDIPPVPAPVIDLGTLTPVQGFIIQGDGAGDRAGYSVSSAGDVNGDGFADLIVGAPQGDDGGTSVGEAYVVFGRAGGFGADVGGRRVIDLTTLSAAQGFIISGDAADEAAGFSVSDAGDLNGDGFADLIVGALAGSSRAASASDAHVVFGTASGFGTPDAAGRDVIDLADLSPVQGFIIQGATASGPIGTRVSSAGDVNGDGFADLIVAVPGSDAGSDGPGEAYVVFGSAAGFGTLDGAGRSVIDVRALTAAKGFVIQGDEGGDQVGRSVSSAGDVNGDGFDDLIVGAPRGDDGGDGAGEAYVIFGAASGFGVADGAGRQVIDLATLGAAQGFIIQGDTVLDLAGTSVSSAGDVNGDGFGDLIVGAPGGADGGFLAGEAYVVFGGAGGFGVADGAGRQVIDLTTLTAVQGFVIQGHAFFDTTGFSVSGAGDVNGDGFADLIVGAPRGDSGGSDSGTAYLVFGGAGGFGVADGAGRQVIDLTTFTAAQGFIIQGDVAGDWAGWSVSSAGDLNRDGFDDLIVGAVFGGDGGTSAGEAYVVFGGAFGGGSAPVTSTGTAAAEMLIGGIGADTLTGGGGLDVFRGGAGDDRMVVTNATFRSVDGGNGRDSLAISGSGITLDLTVNPMPRIESVERIDLTGAGANTLVLDRLAALGLTEQRSAGLAILTVDGNAGDTLRFSETSWSEAGSLVEGGVAYRRVVSADGSVEIRVAQAVTLEIPTVRAPVIDVTTLTAAQGFIIRGDAAGDQVGWSVSSAGDVNGDGFADLIVGAPQGYAGEAYVVFGGLGGFGAADGTGRPVLDLTTLTAAQGFIIQGDLGGDLAGYSVSTAGDVNGDGFADLLVGAVVGNDGGLNAGEAYVVFGGPGNFGLADGAGRQVIDLTTLGATQGFIVQGDATFDLAGGSVATAGDVNGDGFADLIIGATSGDDGGAGAGEAYVVFGTAGGFGAVDGTGRRVIDLTTLSPAQGFIIQGDAAGDRAGYSVSSAGDVNGDGFDDLIVGAMGGDDGGTGAGEAYVVFGTAAGFGTLDGTGRRVIDLTALAPAQGFVIQGHAADDRAGRSVSGAGDVNGDGFADLVVGAPSGGGGTFPVGEAYVLFGGAGTFGAVDVTGRAVMDLTTLTPAQGFIIQGDAPGDQAGFSVSSAGDVNGDGLDDLIVGAPAGDDTPDIGAPSYVVFGTVGGFGAVDGTGRRVVDLTFLTGAQGYVIQGDDWLDLSGRSVSSAGDVNGDGFDDAIVGAPRNDDGGTEAGQAFVVFGGAFGGGSRPVTTTGTAAVEMLIGGRGDDTLTGGGGADVFRGGAGDDRIVVSDSAFHSIDGGTGTDIFVFGGSGMTLDTTAIANTRIAGIEGFDMTAHGNNTLVIGAMDVLHFSETPQEAFTGSSAVHRLVIEGDAGDRLDLRDFDPDGAGSAPNRFWTETASNRTLVNGAGGTYDYWTLSDGVSTLAVLAVSNDVSIL